jgi:predicted dienelactone hydrolase
MHPALLAKRGLIRSVIVLLSCCLATWSGMTFAQTIQPGAPYPVGMKQLEYVDAAQGNRHLALTLFYPAVLNNSDVPMRMVFFTNLHLYKNAQVVSDNVKRPLIMFSHGHGSNGLYYAWFAEFMASRGYIVATLYHYRANTYDATIMYTRSKLWQRPVDISKDITFLLNDKAWGPHIDPNRIGVAGHSQGGFTSLWIGGAMVNPDKYLAYQRAWKNNQLVPASLRKELPLDAKPALKVYDSRVKAVLAMAPGDLPGFGMDEEGVAQLKVPAYIIVGARDTQAPPKENAEFAARYAPHAQLDVMPGLVDHEIFANECDQEGRDTWPEACIDAPGIDRTSLHEYIGNAALKFFDANLNVQRSPPN